MDEISADLERSEGLSFIFQTVYCSWLDDWYKKWWCVKNCFWFWTCHFLYQSSNQKQYTVWKMKNRPSDLSKSALISSTFFLNVYLTNNTWKLSSVQWIPSIYFYTGTRACYGAALPHYLRGNNMWREVKFVPLFFARTVDIVHDVRTYLSY